MPPTVPDSHTKDQLAGRDTTAVWLTWSLYRLCIHPDIEKKVLAEIEGIDGPLTFEAVGNLEYTQAFLSEVLRLHPR